MMNYFEFKSSLKSIENIYLDMIFNQLLQELNKDVYDINNFFLSLQDLDDQNLSEQYANLKNEFESKKSKTSCSMNNPENHLSVKRQNMLLGLSTLTHEVNTLASKLKVIKLEAVRREKLERISQEKTTLKKNSEQLQIQLDKIQSQITQLESTELSLKSSQIISQSKHSNTGNAQTIENDQQENASR